jgi:hypothetical protein
MRAVRLTLIEERLNRRTMAASVREVEAQAAMLATDVGELLVEVRRLRLAVESAYVEGWRAASTVTGGDTVQAAWEESDAKRAVER